MLLKEGMAAMGLEVGESQLRGPSMRPAGEKAREAIRAELRPKGSNEDGPPATPRRRGKGERRSTPSGRPNPSHRPKKRNKTGWQTAVCLLILLADAATKATRAAPLARRRPIVGSGVVTRSTLFATEIRRRRMGGLGLRVATTVWELGVANVRAAKERGPPSADLVNNSNADGHTEILTGAP